MIRTLELESWFGDVVALPSIIHSKACWIIFASSMSFSSWRLSWSGLVCLFDHLGFFLAVVVVGDKVALLSLLEVPLAPGVIANEVRFRLVCLAQIRPAPMAGYLERLLLLLLWLLL